MKKKILSMVLACFMLLTLCASCAASSTVTERPTEAGNAIGEDRGAFKNAPDYTGGEEDAYEEVDQSASSAPAKDASAPLDYEKKIVRNADLKMEVVGVETCYQKLLDWAKKNGGYESSHRTENYEGSSYVQATIKIKAENLDAFLAYAGTLGNIIDSVVSSDDVTARYYDLETRLKTMRTTLDKYYEFLKATTTVKEMLEVQSAIDDLILEIESIEGNLRYLKAQVTESTVTLTLTERPDPVKQKEDIDWNALSFSDMLTLTLRSGVSLGNILVSILQWIFICSPYLILLLILYIIVRVMIKRRRKRHPKKSRPVPVYYAPTPVAPVISDVPPETQPKTDASENMNDSKPKTE